MSDVTQILHAIKKGDAQAAEELLPLVYEELRKVARAHMRQERAEHTLQPTALVHEAYLRLVGDVPLNVDGRGRFFAAASEAMRRILIEHARRRQALRHGGGKDHIRMREMAEDIPAILPGRSPEEVLDVSDALDRFAEFDAAKAELVKLVYFGGLSLAEAAEVLGISRMTANRHWVFAKAWLHDAVRGTEGKSP